MSFATTRSFRLLIVSTVLGALLPGAASAQLEEVIVTAQKHEESLQDVGISISALSAKKLEQIGVTDTVDITQQVPGLQLFTFSPAFTVFALRGVSQNNFQDNLEAPVAVYLDGAYIATMNALNMQLFDMDRVEVLRGPQGTLFGRNADGGVIQFVSHKATEKDTNGYLEGQYADFNTYSLEGAVGGAFSDHMRGRLSGRWEKSDGYVEAGTALGETRTGRDSNGANGYALRGNLQFDAGDNVLIDFTGYYSKDSDVPTGQYVVSFAGFDANTGLGSFHNAIDPANPGAGPQNFDPTPITGDGWHHWSNENPFMDREVKAANGTISASLGSVEFTSITHWLEMDKFYIEDSAGGLAFFPYNTINNYDQWSEEIRFSSNQKDRFRWQVGGYYLDMTWDTFQSVAGAAILGGTSDTQKMSTFGDIDSKNWSVFGQFEFDLADKWTLVVGGRWSQDNKHLEMSRVYEDVPNGIPPGEVFNIDAVPIPDIDNIDYGDWAGRVQLNFKPSDATLLYASFNRGIKGGNWSLDPLGGVAPADLKHDPEKLDAYELGLKTDFLGGRARLNAAAFYYDYHDYQAFSILVLTPQVSNSDATAHGGEIEFSVSPTDGLDLSLGASFVDSKVDAVNAVFPGVTVSADFPLAPKTSLNMVARYEWPMLGGHVAAQIDGKWNDDQHLEGTGSEVSFEPSYSVWNAHISYETENRNFGLALWCKNLTDEQYRLYDLDLGLLGFVEQVYGAPRQYGLTATVRF